MGYSSPEADHEIVGVVDDFAFGSMRVDPRRVMLTVMPRDAMHSTLNVVVRTRDPHRVAEALRQLVTRLVPNAPRIEIVSGRDLVAADLGRERLGAWFFSGFGLVAILLSVGGIFGLIAYLAESRHREFGVRLALGATSVDLLRIALRAGLVPSAVGAGLGLIGAAWLSKAAETFLIGLSRFDPFSYVAAYLSVIAVAASTEIAAAWRVRRVSPSEVLRAQ
jgi:hypothetical protein